MDHWPIICCDSYCHLVERPRGIPIIPAGLTVWEGEHPLQQVKLALPLPAQLAICGTDSSP